MPRSPPDDVSWLPPLLVDALSVGVEPLLVAALSAGVVPLLAVELEVVPAEAVLELSGVLVMPLLLLVPGLAPATTAPLLLVAPAVVSAVAPLLVVPPLLVLPADPYTGAVDALLCAVVDG